mmetsp:Transcript_50108/g.92479  ORF Transcript_50108/g.92479 Transcript_50108/m.92479 type:complete len:96 (-) Transcript_50108:38-325(-)
MMSVRKDMTFAWCSSRCYQAIPPSCLWALRKQQRKSFSVPETGSSWIANPKTCSLFMSRREYQLVLYGIFGPACSLLASYQNISLWLAEKPSGML